MMKKANLRLMTVAILAVLTFSTSAFAGSLVAWGDNDVDQCNVPVGDNFVAVAAGGWHNLALRSDGSLVAWGDDYEGLNNVPPGNDFIAIACGSYHNLALKSDGSIVTWGDDNEGLNNVPPGNDFIAIACGSFHSLALKSDGSVLAWGDNLDNQCDVPGGNDFVAIAGGMYHSLGLKTDGTVLPWGYNYSGEVDVPDGNHFVAIGGGQTLSTALRSDGTLAAWGWNALGQCDIPEGNDFTAFATCFNHTLALESDGTIVAWGDNYWGQCNVPSGDNFGGIAAGDYHSVALTADPELTELEIVGPNTVVENSQTQYQAFAHYSDGAIENVTALAEWSVEPNDIASITGGLLTVDRIDSSGYVTVTAKHDDGETDIAILVKSFADAASEALVKVAEDISNFDPNTFKNSNMANALTNKIDEVLAMIDSGMYEDALDKLENDILKKTDGCANSGVPDKNDWIETCEQQEQIYPLVLETIEYVESLME